MTLEEYEDELRPKLRWKSVAEIPNFPYSSFSTVRQALASREISLGIDYTTANLLAGIAYGVIWATVSSLVAAMPILLSIALLAVAFFRGDYWLLLGIPLAFFGQFSSNPYNRARTGCFVGAVAIACVAVWLLFNHKAIIGIALLAFPLTFVTNSLLYTVNQTRLRNWATLSEVVFIGLLEEGKLGLLNLRSGRPQAGNPIPSRSGPLMAGSTIRREPSEASPKCPNCRLVNPPEASTCDCGYDFAARTMGSSFLRTRPYRNQVSKGERPSLKKAAYLVLSALALVLVSVIPGISESFGPLLRVLGYCLWLVGTITWAQAKGQHWCWGLLGLSVLGACIIAFLPDRTRV